MPVRFALALALLFAWLPAAADDEERVLLVLQSTGNPEVKLEIIDEREPRLADPARAATRWRLEPGDSITEDGRPAQRVVELYTGTPQALSLVARVVVRYFRTGKGWTPHFRLDQQPVVVNVNGRWQPLLLPGMAGFLVRYGHTLPNAEGFFPTLEFGPAGGVLALAGWRVH